MTRIFLFTTFIVLFCCVAAAQNAMPTKDETANFLNRKVEEASGSKWEYQDENGKTEVRERGTFSFTMKGNYAVYGQLSATGFKREFTFNPAHIETVNATSGKGTHGLISVKFSKPLAKETSTHVSSGRVNVRDPRDLFYLYFLDASPKDGERIVKALLHLRDLAKAEDELF